MFRLLGKIVRRAWPLVLAAWIIVLVGTWFAAPSWNKAAEDREFAFLPPNAPSLPQKAFAEAFPQSGQGSNVVLVLHRAGGEGDQLTADLKFISDKLEPGIRKIAEAARRLAYEVKASDEPLFSDRQRTGQGAGTAQAASIIAASRLPTPLAPAPCLSAPTEKPCWSWSI